MVLAIFKWLEVLQDVLPVCDQNIAASLGGVITPEEYGAMVIYG